MTSASTGKLTIQLVPATITAQQLVANNLQCNPRLQLYVGSQKSIASVIKHLHLKWAKNNESHIQQYIQHIRLVPAVMPTHRGYSSADGKLVLGAISQQFGNVTPLLFQYSFDVDPRLVLTQPVAAPPPVVTNRLASSVVAPAAATTAHPTSHALATSAPLNGGVIHRASGPSSLSHANGTSGTSAPKHVLSIRPTPTPLPAAAATTTTATHTPSPPPAFPLPFAAHSASAHTNHSPRATPINTDTPAAASRYAHLAHSSPLSLANKSFLANQNENSLLGNWELSMPSLPAHTAAQGWSLRHMNNVQSDVTLHATNTITMPAAEFSKPAPVTPKKHVAVAAAAANAASTTSHATTTSHLLATPQPATSRAAAAITPAATRAASFLLSAPATPLLASFTRGGRSILAESDSEMSLPASRMASTHASPNDSATASVSQPPSTPTTGKTVHLWAAGSKKLQQHVAAATNSASIDASKPTAAIDWWRCSNAGCDRKFKKCSRNTIAKHKAQCGHTQQSAAPSEAGSAAPNNSTPTKPPALAAVTPVTESDENQNPNTASNTTSASKPLTKHPSVTATPPAARTAIVSSSAQRVLTSPARPTTLTGIAQKLGWAGTNDLLLAIDPHQRVPTPVKQAMHNSSSLAAKTTSNNKVSGNKRVRTPTSSSSGRATSKKQGSAGGSNQQDRNSSNKRAKPAASAKKLKMNGSGGHGKKASKVPADRHLERRQSNGLSSWAADLEKDIASSPDHTPLVGQHFTADSPNILDVPSSASSAVPSRHASNHTGMLAYENSLGASDAFAGNGFQLEGMFQQRTHSTGADQWGSK